MKNYIIKNQHGKYIHKREHINEIISMLHNNKEEIMLDGHRVTLQSKKTTDDGCEVVLFIEGI